MPGSFAGALLTIGPAHDAEAGVNPLIFVLFCDTYFINDVITPKTAPCDGKNSARAAFWLAQVACFDA